MFRYFTLASLISVIPATLCTPAHAQTDSIPLDRNDVPERVWTTVRSVAPATVFTEFGYEVEDGQTVYELAATVLDGLHLEIDVLEDGTLQEIEWETPISEVQTPVIVEFHLAFPGGNIRFVERSIRPNGYTVYELEGVDAAGSPVELDVLDNGRRLMVLNATDNSVG